MSFHTVLSIYRPGTPPKLSGANIASFLLAFARLGIADEKGTIDYRIKFGRFDDVFASSNFD